MQNRSLAALTICCSLFAGTGCKKRQESQAHAESATTPIAAASQQPPRVESASRFSSQVENGKRFERQIAPNLYFRLEPYAGSDSGWTVRIVPGTDEAAAAMDCIGAIAEPLHGDTTREIEPPAAIPVPDNWKNREFAFVANTGDCKTAWNLMNAANYPSKASKEEREAAGEKLRKLPRDIAKFTIADAKFSSAAGAEQRVFQSIKFDVELLAIDEKSIRVADLKTFVATHLGELNADLADLQTDCGEGQAALQSLAPPVYGDLDKDGLEEAAIEGWSCLAGNGGADFRGVLKLLPDGKLAVLPVEPLPKVYKGKNTYDGLRGHMVVAINNGMLEERYGIYTGSEANCCAEGGERHFVFRWDGQKFVLNDMMDVPAEKK